MTPEQWSRVDQLFHEAASVAVGERSSWLARACDGDEVIRREVESLLEQEASRPGALDGHAVDEMIARDGPESLVGRTLGGYEFLSLIDEGGMGQVYRARDLTLPRVVAIKIVTPAFTHDPVRRARFREEADLLATFAHPHIAHIYAFVEAEGRFLLAMELVPGETLANRVARGPMKGIEALGIAAQIAQALEAAHEQGVVHRDLKPANIRITPDGVVKVLDFGLATTSARPTLAGASSGVTPIRPAALFGTVAYMSPEQARGEDLDKRTDIWAFGCVLFEMLTGKRPFNGATAADVRTAILDGEPDWSALPPTVPLPVTTLLRRCFDKDRKRRLRDIGEARIVLDTLAPQVTAASTAAPRLRYVAMTAVGAAAIALSVWAYSRLTRPADVERTEFQMLPPPGVRWGEFPPEPVARVSPDGRRMVFAGRSSSGDGERASALWVRELGDKNAHVLPGSNDYRGNLLAPFWSADSQTIAYCAGTAAAPLIKKIRVDGRPAGQFDAPCIGDGSWNRRGQILFTGERGLLLVGENGGTPTRITLNGGSPEDHRHPRFLPDGVRFLFTQRATSDDRSGIYLGRIDDKSTRRLFPDASMAEYVETASGGSYIFFVRIADLIAQRVDRMTLAATAPPIVVAKRMRMSLGRLPSFSVSSTLLAYRNNVGDSELVWIDRTGRLTGARYGGNTSLQSPALSHDGRTIAYARLNPDTNYYELWTIDVSTGIEQKAYAAETLVSAAAFSPDDTRLAFSAGTRAFILALGRSDATEANPYPRQSSNCNIPPFCSAYITDWSADGQVLIQSVGVVAWFHPGQATPPTQFVRGVHGRLSRDGQWLAFTSAEIGHPEVYVQHFPDGGRKRRISTGGGFQPFWRVDGSELFYRNDLGDVFAVQLRLGAQVDVLRTDRLFRERLPGGGDEYAHRDFVVSGDGQRFLINRATTDTPPVTVVQNWARQLMK